MLFFSPLHQLPTQTLFQKIRNIDDNILSQCETQLKQALAGSSLIQPSKDSNARFLLKVSYKQGCVLNSPGETTKFVQFHFIFSFAQVC